MIKHAITRLLLILILITPFSGSFASDGVTYVFSAPPRGTEAQEREVYGPIAAYLSQVTGKNIVYKHPDNWLNYQNQMQRGKYDLVFDGPHFISWRMTKVGHLPIAKLPGQLSFVVMTRDDAKLATNSLDGLAGRKVCGLAPPNLATLTMYNQFPNPMRQPQVKEMAGFNLAFKGVMDQQCDAAVMRDKMYNKLQADSKTKSRVIWTSQAISNQGFSAGPRFTADDRKKIANALVSANAQQPLQKFFDRFSKQNKKLLPASAGEYAGLGSLLRDVWGFEQ